MPYRTVAFQSELTPAEAAARLQSALAGAGELRGSVDGDRFRVRRVIRYRNSLLPVVSGTVTHSAGGSEVRLVMRLAWWVLAFGIVWFGAMLAVFVGLMRDGVIPASPVSFLIPMAIVFFGAALFWAPFRYEANLVERLLRALLEKRGPAPAPVA